MEIKKEKMYTVKESDLNKVLEQDLPIFVQPVQRAIIGILNTILIPVEDEKKN